MWYHQHQQPENMSLSVNRSSLNLKIWWVGEPDKPLDTCAESWDVQKCRCQTRRGLGNPHGKSRGKLHEHHKWGIVHCRGWGDGLWIFPGHWDKIEILGNVPPHDLECVFPTFRMFCWGILPKVECDKILSNPLLSKHGNGQSIKIIHLVGRFPHWHLHVHLMSKLAMFDDRRVQKMSYGNQGLTKDPRFFWK